MIRITNDTTTLNGALSQLGETLASNITQKGVTASASDGLTTLANKVLQITGGGGSTIIYQPTLDGTESITTIATYTPTITNNTLTNGCGYLTNGWDNTIDWELTFDYYTTGDNNGYLVIPKGTTQRDYKGIQQWYCNQLNFYVDGTKPTGYISNATSCNEWISVKITKIGYVWTVYYNDVQKTQWDTESYASTVDSWTEMCIGLDKNSSSRYATIKNIVVKSIGGGSDCSQYTSDIREAICTINGYRSIVFTFIPIYENALSAMDICDSMVGTVDGQSVTLTKGSTSFTGTYSMTPSSNFSFTLAFDDTNYTIQGANNGTFTISGSIPSTNGKTLNILFVQKGGGIPIIDID